MQNYKLGAEEFLQTNITKDLESLSGHSSTLLNTFHFREYLKKMFVSKKIKSISDCPCGDWNWMRTVKLNGIDYIGYDILPEIVKMNTEAFPKYKFKQFDAVKQVLPKTDLIICKDFLTHLHDDVIVKVIENFKKSKSKYLLTTSYKSGNIVNMQENWGFKELSVEKFGLVSVEQSFDSPNRYHGLYKLK